MLLKIKVDHKKLIDSPYGDSNKEIFSFIQSDSHSVIEDIVNGNPTCYLVSGYRGSGKSSFVKKLEEGVRAKSNNTLFVHLNFAKHKARSILLRKLIRSFYLELTKQKVNEGVYKSLQRRPILKDTLTGLADLFDRTFYEVAKNSNIRISKRKTFSWNFTGSVKDIVIAVCPFICLIFLIVLEIFPVWLNRYLRFHR